MTKPDLRPLVTVLMLIILHGFTDLIYVYIRDILFLGPWTLPTITVLEIVIGIYLLDRIADTATYKQKTILSLTVSALLMMVVFHLVPPVRVTSFGCGMSYLNSFSSTSNLVGILEYGQAEESAANLIQHIMYGIALAYYTIRRLRLVSHAQ